MHYMHLNGTPFEEIKAGLKKIEIRLDDEKRKKVNLDELIEFTNRDTGEKLQAKVLGIARYKTYEELVNLTPLEHFGPRFSSKEEIIRRGVFYWSEDVQKKYGFVAIQLEVQK